MKTLSDFLGNFNFWSQPEPETEYELTEVIVEKSIEEEPRFLPEKIRELITEITLNKESIIEENQLLIKRDKSCLEFNAFVWIALPPSLFGGYYGLNKTLSFLYTPYTRLDLNLLYSGLQKAKDQLLGLQLQYEPYNQYIIPFLKYAQDTTQNTCFHQNGNALYPVGQYWWSEILHGKMNVLDFCSTWAIKMPIHTAQPSREFCHTFFRDFCNHTKASIPIYEAIDHLTSRNIASYSIPWFERQIAAIMNYQLLPAVSLPVSVVFSLGAAILIMVAASHYTSPIKEINPRKIKFPFNEESAALLARLNIDIRESDSVILGKLENQANRALQRRECRHAFFLGLYEKGIRLEKDIIEDILLEAELIEPAERNIPLLA